MEPIKEFSRTVLSLDNCIIPTERLLNTPSVKDGMSHDLETDLRIVGCEYIQSAGLLLRLPQVAMATAQVLFQRYYYSKSFVKYHIQSMAMACLFLAAKIEEDCRRLRDVINVFHHLKQKRMGRPIEPMEYMGEEYFKSKNIVIKYERYLLKELGFCVHVKHPHKLIITYLQILGLEKNTTLAQKAWNFMNDSLRTNVFVRYAPETIACACISLAARQLQIPLPQKPAWWLLFDAEYKDIQTICKELTALYVRPVRQLEDLENEVAILREELTKKQIEVKEVSLKLELPGSIDSPNPASPSIQLIKTQSQLSSHGASSQPTSDTRKESQGSGDDEKGSKNTPLVENGEEKPAERSRSPVSPHKDTASVSDHSLGTTPQAYKSIDAPIKIGNEDSGSELVNSPPSPRENGLPKRYSKDYENDREVRKKRHSRHKEKRHRSTSRERRHRRHRDKEVHKIERIVTYTDRDRDHERDHSSRPYNRHR